MWAPAQGVTGLLWAELRPPGAAVVPPGRPQPWGPGGTHPSSAASPGSLPSSSLGERKPETTKTIPWPQFPKEPFNMLKQVMSHDPAYI